MRQAISSLELHYVVEELQDLVDSKIDKIFQPLQNEIVLQLHKTGTGKLVLRIAPGRYIYLTEYRQENPQTPKGYCVYLRKKLSNARIKRISQLEFERVVEFIIETKEEQFKLYAEFFPKGNIVLTDKDRIILSPLENQIWKDRTIKKGEKYIYPKQKYNLLEIEKDDLKKISSGSDKESVVKTLAIELGLGGKHSEEICEAAKVDKDKNPKLIDTKEINALFSAIKEIIGKKIDMNKILDSELTNELKETANVETNRAKNTQMEKAEKISEMQKKQLKKIQKEAEENQKIGEKIYENYQLIDEILKEIKKARAKFSLQEIKEKLKDHKVIKELKEKENKVVVEI